MVVRKLAWFCLATIAGLMLSSAAQAQTALQNNDLSFDGLYQFTSTASGNGISDRTSKSGGAAAAFRHSYHWWLGYEAGYSYTRYTEYYTDQVFGIQHNQHEFSGSYYVHGPHTLGGIQPFALAGVSAVILSPSLNGGQNVGWQARPGINYGAGVNVPLLTSYFGLRFEYRGVYYKAPDFGNANLTTNAWRNTSEPMAGLYFRF
jgi:opacity protein-like surface antigen